MEGASPGFYFQRCLKLWEPDLAEVSKDKREATRPLLARHADGARVVHGDPGLHRALLARQAAAFEAMRPVAHGAIVKRVRNLTPFVTGIGQPHPLETGFAFLKPYGVPYLAASGVKGPVRAASAEEWRGRFGDGEERELLRHYFGSEDTESQPEALSRRGQDDTRGHRRGALLFFDLLPELAEGGSTGWADALRLDIVNPHYGDYYQGKGVPADWLSPVPSYFLTLTPGLEWTLRLLYAPVGDAPRPDWEGEVGPGLVAALTTHGLGAKKTWGYGLFEVLPEAAAAPREKGPPAPPVNAQVAGTRSMIAALRANEVPGKISALERAISVCPPETRPELMAELAQKLKALGWRPRQIDDVLSRLRDALGLKES